MPSLRTCVVYLGLTALTVGTYLPMWKNDFVDFDDVPYIVGNPVVTAGLTWSSCCQAWKPDPTSAPYWMPITWLSFQLDAQFFSTRTSAGERILSPAAFHAHNLFWHTANVLLLFSVCRRLTERRPLSLLIAALFAVHPMHVESVAWAIERKEVLSGFFGLLTLLAYLHYVEKPSRRRYALTATMLLLGLLSKPMLITLPFLLLLLDYWPLCRMLPPCSQSESAEKLTHGRVSFTGLVREKLPLLLIIAIISAITLTMRDQRGTLVSVATVSVSSRIANALSSYNWYVISTFWPTRLAVLYPHLYDNWSLLSAVSGAGTLLACSLLAWWQRWQRPWLIFGWLWFVGSLLPVIGFIQGGKQAWADRFSYWPHIGLFLAVVWELLLWIERLGVPNLVCRLAAAGALGGLTCLTWTQIGFWRDTPTLWQHALSVTHDNDQAHEHLGSYFHAQGEYELAAAHALEAHRIQKQRLLGSSSRIPTNVSSKDTDGDREHPSLPQRNGG